MEGIERRAVTSRRGLRTLGTAAGVILAASCTMIGSSELDPRPPSGGTPTVMPRSGAPVGPALGDRMVEPPSAGGNMDQYRQSGGTYRVLDTSEGYDERGVASWYGEKFHGRPTSSGEPFDMHVPSAAHRTLPLPAWVRVTNLGNGRSVVLRVNDRGPFADTRRRIIDVSYAAAVELGMVGAGTASVRVQAVEPWQTRR